MTTYYAASITEMVADMLESITSDNKARAEQALRDALRAWVEENPERARDELAAFNFVCRIKQSAAFTLH